MKRMFKEGDRVKTKSGIVSTWHGKGTVISDQMTESSVIKIKRDDGPEDWESFHAMPWQLVLLRKENAEVCQPEGGKTL